MKSNLLIHSVALAAILSVPRADAQNLTVTLNGIDPGLTVNGTLNDGQFVQGYATGLNRFTEFDAFCVDPTQDLEFGEVVTYQIQDISNLANYELISRLVGGYLASSQSDNDAAAIQWAIWEITTDTLAGPSLHDGNVRIIGTTDAGTAELANYYLQNVSSFSPVQLVYLTNSQRQDVVTWTPIPEPSTFGLAALTGFVLLRRRRC